MDRLSDDNRAGLSDGKDECTPAIRNRAADRYRERVRMAALEFRGRNAGGHGEAGMESEEGDGVLSSFLGAIRVAIPPISLDMFVGMSEVVRARQCVWWEGA